MYFIVKTDLPQRILFTTILQSVLVIALTTLILPIGSVVQATIIGVDIEAGQGSPTNWTSYTLADVGSTKSNLIDESGTFTSVDFQLIGPTVVQNIAPFSATIIPSHSNDLTTVCCDIVASGPEPFVTTWSGLVPNAPYNYWIFTSSAATDTFTVTGSTADNFVSPQVNSDSQRINGILGSSSSTFASYARQVNASATGTIVILHDSTGTPTPSGYAVELIPEPSTFVLAAFGLLGVGCRRRRRG